MNIISYAVTSLLYFSLVLGLYFCFSNSFKAMHGWFVLRRRLSPGLKDKASLQIIDKLNDIVFLATGKENRGRAFLGFSLGLFFFLLTFGCFSFNFSLAVLLAFLSALIPTVSLVSKIQKHRNKSSKEGLSFATEFLRVYRTEDRNVLTSLEKVSASATEFPFCGKQSYLLLLKLRSAGSRRGVREACSKFAESVGTIWARNMSQLFEYALDGTDISEALTDIISEMMKAKERSEEGKRLNSEAWRMSAYLVPIVYAASVILSVKYLGITMGEFIKNQFFTSAGLLLFILCLLLFCINNMIISFVINRSVDI